MRGRHCRRLLQDASGAPAVEFAILAPVALLVLLALVDLGLGFGAKLQIESELNGLQLESLRSPVEDVRSLTQTRVDALSARVGGLGVEGPVNVTEAYGCPAAASTGSPVEPGRLEDDECNCGGRTCSPYRYFVITVNFRYDLLFGLDIDLPFIASGGGLRSIAMPTVRTMLVDGGWQ